jgi:hypothetical protein
MANDAKRPRGRPSMDPESRKRNNLTMRLRDDTKAILERAATANQRSLSEEIESRVERSVDRGGLLGEVFDLTYRDPQLIGLLLTMGESMRDTLTASRADDWINDPNAFAEVAIAAQQTIEAYRPVGQPKSDIGQLAVATARGTLFKISEDASGLTPWIVAARNRIGDTWVRLRARSRWSGPDGLIAPAPEEGNSLTSPEKDEP